MEIIISDEQNTIKVAKSQLNSLKKALNTAYEMHELPKNCEVSLTLTDDKRIRILNREYRDIDKATDVLSFALQEGEEFPEQSEQPVLLGDIVISVERAAAQAEEYGHSLDRELAYLSVHGFLHLIGYDHLTPADKKAMRVTEEEVLSKLTLTR